MPEVEQEVFSEDSKIKPKRTVFIKAVVSVFCDPSSWVQIDDILASDIFGMKYWLPSSAFEDFVPREARGNKGNGKPYP